MNERGRRARKKKRWEAINKKWTGTDFICTLPVAEDRTRWTEIVVKLFDMPE